jgi:hypothetical protein
VPVAAGDAWSAIAKTLLKGDCSRSRLPHVLGWVGVDFIASELVAQQEEMEGRKEGRVSELKGRQNCW